VTDHPASSLAAMLIAAAVVLGCGASPEPAGTDDGAIIGVKIYETDRDLPELFKQWRGLGVNTVFASEALASKDGFGELAERAGSDLFVIFPVFYAPAELADDPQLWAITDDGAPAKETWVEFACPSREEFRACRVEEAKEIVRRLQPTGLSIDFIRHFVFWEMVAPERHPDTLAQTCFCAHCLMQFAESADLDIGAIPAQGTNAAEWILANAAEEWIRFKVDTITSMAEEIVAGVREIDPEILINLHIVPWRTADYDGAITRIAGQDRAALGAIADYLSPMCYSFMLFREPAWISTVVDDVAEQASCAVLPSIQVAEAYRADEVFRAADFEAALRSALEPPSAGVIFWSWDHIEADPKKAEIIRRVLLDR
jgi:hypothetical protein